MGKLIEIEGKFYKECGVLMLETTQEKAIGLCLRKDNNKLLDYPITESDHNQAIYQHLFITCDDKIKKADWFLHINKEGVYSKPLLVESFERGESSNYKENMIFAVGGSFYPIENNYLLKIISTTDSSLYTNEIIEEDMHMYKKPLPPTSDKFIQAFIESYNQGTPIKRVLVEYKKKYGLFEQEYFIPTIKDNNIIIKKIKDSWTRNEFECKILDLQIAIAKSILDGNTFQDFDVNKWMEENLLI